MTETTAAGRLSATPAPAAWSAAVPWLWAAAVWASSRALVFLGVWLGRAYVPLGNDTWLGGSMWYHRLLRWDSEWYSIIAREGYRYDGNPLETQTVVFYPLYPALCRAVSVLTGLPVIDAMLLVSNLCALAAALVVFRLVRADHGDQTALSAVAALSFFPATVFLSAGYTEALALLLMACFFVALRAERYLAAAMLAGLATATRSSGIALLAPLLFTLWQASGRRDVRLLLPACAMLAVSGLAAYVAYLGLAFGHPMAVSDGQLAFHEHVPMSRRFLDAVLLLPLLRIDWTDFSPAGLDHWFFLLFVALIVLRIRQRLDAAQTLFAAGVLLLPYLTLSGGPAGLTSMARFNVVSFPLFATLAVALRASPWKTAAVTAVFGGLLPFYAALFSQWQWVG